MRFSGHRTKRFGYAAFCIIALILCFFSSCSNQKNTALTRRVQALKANYNTYYNGKLSFIEGVEAQRSGNKDNYLEPVPVLMTANKSTAQLGKSNFDKTIEKCQKTIKQHSITKRPKWNGKTKTEKDKIWLSQREYNPFLYKAWFLMGDAQFRKGEYMEAASTYAYMQRLYFSKPNIVAKARLLEAKCYAEQNWIFEAEDLITRAERDSFPVKLNAMKALVKADCALRDKKYGEAAGYLEQCVKKVRNNHEKARLYYLLGQLYQKTGDSKKAYKAFGKVYSKNPPYELAFNARIQQTEVMSKGQSTRMIGRLKRMSKSPKNVNYLDQVFYAIGNIYLAKGDTASAINAYKEGVEKSARNGAEKGIVQLRLGELYWDKEKFAEAKECYSSVIGLLDKDRDDYKAIDDRSKILDELYPSYSVVELQDSLQRLARMDSVSRMNVIKKMIADLKKKEKEAAARQDINATNQQRQNQVAANQQAVNNRNSQEALWYFYNLSAVSSGKTEFQKRWGMRKLADHWRRRNKTVLDDEADSTAVDSAMMDSTLVDSLGNPLRPDSVSAEKTLTRAERRQMQKDSINQLDPHRPEYYLKDIPLTDEQMEASNALLVDGLFNSANIIKDRMENFPLAERLYMRVLDNWPDFEHKDDIYYNLFLLYARTGNLDKADTYLALLKSEYPDNANLPRITDPNFLYKAQYGVAIEDSIYQKTYSDYLAGNYQSVVSSADYIEREYPDGANRPRFMFLSMMSHLNLGNTSAFLTGMKEIVEKYPQSTVSELAGLYVKGVKEGRTLMSGNMNNGSIWDRRSGALSDADSIAADTLFSKDRNTNFVFVIAYEPDSIDDKALVFEMANYNFSKFSVRNFDISIVKGDAVDMCQIRPFRNYDEAYIYFHKLMNDREMKQMLAALKLFIISEDNLDRLKRGRSFADYFDYYKKHFDRIGSLRVDESLLDEPTDIPQAEDIPDEPQNTDERGEDDDLEEDNYIF